MHKIKPRFNMIVTHTPVRLPQVPSLYIIARKLCPDFFLQLVYSQLQSLSLPTPCSLNADRFDGAVPRCVHFVVSQQFQYIHACDYHLSLQLWHCCVKPVLYFQLSIGTVFGESVGISDSLQLKNTFFFFFFKYHSATSLLFLVLFWLKKSLSTVTPHPLPITSVKH